MFEIFNKKKVLITGHTGFKGSWLAQWLIMMKANVYGIGLQPFTNPSHFEKLGLKNKLTNHFIDIRNFKKLSSTINDIAPDFIFHLAAQSLVGKAYENSLETYQTNFIGTLNLLESLKKFKKKCVTILITSDKCYENKEWIWGYKETDDLGGIDPYSASKGASEIMIRSQIKSFFPKIGNIKIAIGRAGNVIGGGDWSEKRIIPDAIKAWSENKPLALRNPLATRPWQHVLEPLSGYLQLAKLLKNNNDLHGEAFNFGPPQDQNYPVENLIEEMSMHWENVKWQVIDKNKEKYYESGLLKLNCDKALTYLSWRPTLNFYETVKFTTEWYKSYYSEPSLKKIITKEQIYKYIELTKKKKFSDKH